MNSPRIDPERFLSMIRFITRQKLDDFQNFQLDSKIFFRKKRSRRIRYISFQILLADVSITSGGINRIPMQNIT